MAPLTGSSVAQELFQPYSPLVTLALPVTAALALHAAVQIREPYSHHFSAALLVTLAGVTYFLQDAWHISTAEASWVTARMLGVFAATIAASMAVYRVFLHPLRHVPGPLSCKLSMWTWVLADWQGRRHHLVQEMHNRYGDVVRIGPREISCTNPAALTLFYGPEGPAAKAIRGPWYTAQSMYPGVHSLQNEPTLPEHSRRRRDWSPAFSVRALNGYKANIQRNASMLLEQIEKLSRMGPVDMRECMMWFGFDVMGELGFGRSFDTLKVAKTSEEVHLVETGVRSINTIANVPYVAHIMRFLPSPIQQFEAWLEDALKWRMSHHGEREFVDADVFAYLLGEQGKQKRKLDKLELRQDCMLMVVAGSDTTSNCMTFCLYELAKRPGLVRRIREELARARSSVGAAAADGGGDEFDALRDGAALLNACLNETLRLWPPVPSGLQRTLTTPLTLPAEVAGRGEALVLPANTTVSTHTWTMQRDPRSYFEPESFVPERWLDEGPSEGKRGAHNAKAWAPFGYGSTSCIGKNLAFMEMRLVLAQFISQFDFSISPAADKAFLDSIRDQFVVSAGDMRLQVTPREKARP